MSSSCALVPRAGAARAPRTAGARAAKKTVAKKTRGILTGSRLAGRLADASGMSTQVALMDNIPLMSLS